MAIKLSYKEFLGLTDEEFEQEMSKVDEPMYIDTWGELDKMEINGYKFSILGEKKERLLVEDLSGRNIATFNVDRTPSFAIESFLMVLEVYAMVLNGRDVDENRI